MENPTLSRFKDWINKHREEKPRLFKGLKYTSIAAVAGVFLVFAFVLSVYWGAFGKLPVYAELKAIQNNTASQVYSEDGILLGKYYIQNRLNADFGEIAPNVLNALVATEDARFFKHDGIDLRAWMRVFLRTVLMQDSSGGGGSTLSQQLAKNLYPREDHGVFSVPVSKFKEMFIARRLEKLYTKEELLNLYLNTVPFGGNIYGIKVAAQRFFNTSPKYLKPEQSAVLVGMLKANTYYDPVRNPENALDRRNTVLHQMHKYEYLTINEKDSLQKLPLELDFHQESSDEGLATYFREHLRHELKAVLKEHPKPDGSTYNLYTDGLRVYTTIDARLQGYAERAVSTHMKKLQADFDNHWKGGNPLGDRTILTTAMRNSRRYKSLKKQGLSEKEINTAFAEKRPMKVFSWEKGTEEREMSPMDSINYYLKLLNAGFFAMEPQSGKVRAWVGGIDHSFFKYDHVKSKRQAGSIFKPIVYTAALQSGVQPCNYVDNFLTTYTDYEDWKPQNSDGKYEGVYSMEGGLSRSVNTVAVDMIMKTGVDPVRELAQKMGITTDIPEVPSIALGVADVSLYEMIQVYATFANQGRRTTPQYLSRIETADGKVIVDVTRNQVEEPEQVISEDEATMITRMLQTVVNEGTGQRLRRTYNLTNDIAGKTGTTQNQSDGWFIGFTPKLVAGSWVGGEYPQIHFNSIALGQGANMALPIWGEFYRSAANSADFSNWQDASFAPLSDSLYSVLNCERWLERRPVFVEELKEPRELWSEILGVFKGNKKTAEQVDAGTATKRRTTTTTTTRSERSKEIERHNNRLEKKRKRKKKVKKFWDKVRGKN